MTTPRTPPNALGNLASIKSLLEGTPADINDVAASRLGLFQDKGGDRYIWLGLPHYAPAATGITLGTYQVMEGDPPVSRVRTLQALPIEGIAQFIPPGYRSRERSFNIVTPEDTESQGVPILGKLRTGLEPTQGALRINWHESYATHGGPYGLRALAQTPTLSVPFIEWQRIPESDNPRAGRIIRAFNAFADIVEQEVFDGITADVTLYMESRLFTPVLPIDPENAPTTNIGEIALLASTVDRRPDRGGD